MSIWGLTVKRRGYEDQPWSEIWSRTVWDKLPTVSEEFSDSIFRTGGKGTMFLRNSAWISLRLLYVTCQKTLSLNLCNIWDLKNGVDKDSSFWDVTPCFFWYIRNKFLEKLSASIFRIVENNSFLWSWSSLKMEAASFSSAFIFTYQSARRHCL